MVQSSSSTIRSICVYCGSSTGSDPAFVEQATILGSALAAHNIRLVYGGGDQGLMGALARAVLQGKGRVLGVIPDFLLHAEQAGGARGFEDCEMITVADMHTRKKKMFDEADAFIALPGGIGTLEELVEIQTWSQLKRHEKPMGVLNTNGFWTPYINFLEHMHQAHFLHNPKGATPLVFDHAEDVVPYLLGLS